MIVRYDDQHSVLYGRCLHRGAHLADGRIEGDDLICGIHNWDYQFETGVSSYSNDECLERFESWVEDDAVYVDQDQLSAWLKDHPQV